MGEPSTADEPAEATVSVEALLTRARDQVGADQLWSLAVVIQALRERRALHEALDWVEGQLQACLDAFPRGAAAIPPAIIDALVDLARRPQ